MLMLTKVREGKGMTKAQVARAANLDQGLLSKIESGRVRPYPVELDRLAKALGVLTRMAPALLEEVEHSSGAAL